MPGVCFRSVLDGSVPEYAVYSSKVFDGEAAGIATWTQRCGHVPSLGMTNTIYVCSIGLNTRELRLCFIIFISYMSLGAGECEACGTAYKREDNYGAFFAETSPL